MKLLPTALLAGTLLFSLVRLPAQCVLSVDAGEDIVVCAGTSSTRLAAAVGGDVIDFSWSPTTNLSSATSLTPLVFLDGTPQTLTLTARGFDPADNLIVNGDFEAGDSDFTTQYAPASGGIWGPLSAEGEYTVDDNTADTHNNFGNCTDHTSGSGMMMVVNGSDQAGQQVWCQQVSVTAGTDYVFNAFAMKVVNDANDAELQFSIDGLLLGSPFPVSGGVCSWLAFNAPYTAPISGPVEICVVNQNTAVGGNDFALDDIFFGEVCTATDEVTISVVDVQADAPATVEIPCEGQVVIDGSASTTGSNIFYNWTTAGGNILSGQGTPIITVNQPGTYTLEVTYDDGVTGCTDEVTVTVTDDEPTAVAVATTPGRIDCTTPVLQLSGAGSTEGDDWEYSWTTPDGNIVSGENTLNPTIDAGGTYEIVVFNSVSGCTALEVVFVGEDRDPPVASIAPAGEIACGGEGITLDGTASDAGSGFSFAWTTPDGDIASGESTLTPFVTSAGTYQLVVGRDANGCTDTAVVVVSGTLPPVVSIAEPASLTCVRSTTTLTATSSEPATFSWSTPDGTLINGQTEEAATAGSPGIYVLEVTGANGCTVRDSVAVTEQRTPPLADAGEPVAFTCGTAQASLDGTGSTTGDHIVYEWITIDGNIISGARTQVPAIDQTGEYILTVTDTLTGCSTQDTVRINSDDQAPPVAVSVAGNLDCTAATRVLDGSASASGEGYVFAWSTNDGNFATGQHTLTPTVDAPGTYLLTVTDTLNQCSGSRSVTVTRDTTSPVISIGPDLTLDCRQPTDTLSAAGSDLGAGFTFSWSTAEGRFAGPTNVAHPRVDTAGWYVLSITNDNTGCTSVDSVRVVTDLEVPAAEAGPSGQIDCTTPGLTLGAGVTTPDFDYNWTTTDGQTGDNPDTSRLTVTEPGLYVLLVADPGNGCTTTDSVYVTRDTVRPRAVITPPGELTCRITNFRLGGNQSSAQNDFSYRWTTTDGVFGGFETTSFPSIHAAGTYVLLITDLVNGCVDSAAVTVVADTEPPHVEAGDDLRLDCTTPALDLTTADSDVGAEFVAEWTTADGHFVSPPEGAMASADSAGWYFLTVLNTRNQCEATDSVEVTADFTPPLANAGPPQTITCTRPEVALGSSDPTPGHTFAWTTTDGNLTGGAFTQSTTADAAGTYALTVTATGNGCSAIQEVMVQVDTLPPALTLTGSGELNCLVSSLELAAVTNATVGYSWSTTGGIIAGADNGPVAIVTAAGTYRLEVVGTSNGCRSQREITVAQDTAAPSITLAPAAALNCLETERTLVADDLGPGFVYAWTTADGLLLGGADGPNPNAGRSGNYLLTVTNPANGCHSTDSLLLDDVSEIPALSVAEPVELNCTVTLAELVATTDLPPNTRQLSWTTTDGTLSGPTAELTATATAPGSYRVTVVNPENGCRNETTVTVSANRTPPTIDLATSVDLGCFITDFPLAAIASGQGDLAYRWTTADGNILTGSDAATATIRGAGTYELSVTDDRNGCTATTTVEARQQLLEDFAFDRRDPGCDLPEGTVRFGTVTGGTPPFAFSIDGGENFQTDPVFPRLEPDNYVLVVRDANGCELEDATSVVPAPELELAVDFNPQINFGESVRLAARTNYALQDIDTIIWTPRDSTFSCSNCLDPIVTPSETRGYRVRAETVDGCVAEQFLTVIVNEENPVYFPTAFSPNGDGINDTYHPFASATVVARVLSLNIFDRWGETVFAATDLPPNDPTAGWDGTHRGRPLNAQVLAYSVEIELVGGERRRYKGEFLLMR